MFKAILLLVLFFNCFVMAQDHLFFPVEKADVKKLPQQFEYHLIDKDTFQIGDILIDANKIDFQMKKEAGGKLKTRFRWPSGLFLTGQVVIQDNVGKTIWSSPLHHAGLRVGKAKVSLSSSEALHAEVSSFETVDLTEDILRRLRLLPFFRYCVQKEDASTKIYLCSKSLFFAPGKGSLTILARDSYRPESYVEINGRVVGPEGIVFLQSTKDLLSMRALMLSGASLDVDTRMKDLDLRDIYRNDQDQVVIEAAGAEPARREISHPHSDETWRSSLSLDDPSMFVQGEGGIPLRQGFVLSPNIRAQNLTIQIDAKSEYSTYAESADFYLLTPAGVQLRNYDNNSDVRQISAGHWLWRLRKLQSGKSNRRFISVVTAQGTYVGAADCFRGLRFEATLALGMFPADLDIAFKQRLTPRLSYDAIYHSLEQSNPTAQPMTELSFDLAYRLKPGSDFQLPSHSLFLSFDEFTLPAFSASALSLGFELAYNAPARMQKIYDYFYVRAKAPLLPTSGYTFGTSYQAELAVRRHDLDWNWELAARYESWTFINSPAETDIYRTSLIFKLLREF